MTLNIFMLQFFQNLSADFKIKFFAIVNHALLLYGLVYHFSWQGILVGYVLGYLITLIGISIGYHRYFTHRAFKTTKFFEWTFVITGSLAFLGPVVGWSGIHRLHHANSDTEHDPHSPRNGFLKSWLHIFANKNVPIRYVSDLLRNPILKLQHQQYFLVIAIYFILMYTLLGIDAIYLVSFPAVYLYHITGMVNSLHHLGPDKKYRMKNTSLDLPLFNILTAGESYHAYHHHKASSPIFGKYDPAKLVLPIFSR